MEFNVGGLLTNLKRAIQTNFRFRNGHEETEHSPERVIKDLISGSSQIASKTSSDVRTDRCTLAPQKAMHVHPVDHPCAAVQEVPIASILPSVKVDDDYASGPASIYEDDVSLWNDAPRRSAPLVRSGGEIATVEHKGSLRLALFLSPSLIADVAKAVEVLHEFEPIEEEYDELLEEIEDAQRYLESSNEFIEDAANERRREEIKDKVRQRQEDLQKNLQRKQELRRDYSWQKGRLSQANKSLVNDLASLMREGGLIAPEQDLGDKDINQDEDVQGVESQPERDGNDWSAHIQEDPETGANQVARQQALSRWYEARSALWQARADFEGRENIQENMLREYREKIGAGESVAGYPEDDETWDLYFLVQGGDLTRALFEAEEEQKQALDEVCRQGGPPSDAGSFMESNFPDRSDDGYRLSFEAELKAQIDPEKVEKWRDVVLGCTDALEFEPAATMLVYNDRTKASHNSGTGSSPWTAITIDDQESPAQFAKEDPEAMDIDDWSAESLAFGESLSTIWPQERSNHERVGKWHAMREDMRPQFADRILKDDIRSAGPLI